MSIKNIMIYWHLCVVLDEDISKEEHLDNEFLWNLKMLSQV